MADLIEATYMVTTPLFCSGSRPDQPELRLPSFKGVLRFWWRALAWSRLQGDLAAIQREEDEIFGSTEQQSRLTMRLVAPVSLPTVNVDHVLTEADTGTVVGEGARYLGYGVMEAFASRNRGTIAGQLTRSCLAPPFEFTVRMRVRDLSGEEVLTLIFALMAVGTLGSMGAKSRKGYGSLTLLSWSVNQGAERTQPQSFRDLKDLIRSHFKVEGGEAHPEYTALSAKSRHVLLSAGRIGPLELLDLVGREMVRYRSWGHNGKVLGEPSERLFKDDHDLMKLPAGQRSKHPRRIAFGLPHNYGPGAGEVGPSDPQLDRRGSPLFIHIHQCGSIPVAVLSFLPARFLPTGKSDINVGSQRVKLAPEDGLFQPVHGFLDRLLDPDQRREPFTTVEEA